MIKNNQLQLDRVRENISRIKEYSGKLSELQSSEKDVFWGALKKILEKSKEGHRETVISLLSQKEIDHPGTALGIVKFHAGCISAYDEVLGLVEKNEEACAEASARLVELKSKADEITANIDLQ